MSRPQIRQRPLSYADRLQHRPLRRIDLVVIHCTELPDLGAGFNELTLWRFHLASLAADGWDLEDAPLPATPPSPS